MRQYERVVAGEPVVINIVETVEDLEGFREFIRGNLRVLGCDSETTGLDIYNAGFRCRLVQFGTPVESWVVPVEHGGRFVEDVRLALRGVNKLIFQNASFDLQVFDRTLGVPMHELWPKVTDTKILAHLIDPRAVKEGGTGHSLEDLTRHYIDAEIADSVKTLMKDLAASTKGATTSTIWKKVDLNNPEYELYSGMDPILAARLASKLTPLVPASARPLVRYEHELAEVCALMERTGFLLDVEYTDKLAEQLRVDESIASEKALMYGCDMVNSTDRVADVIEGLGGRINNQTPTGKRQVNDSMLSGFASLHTPLGEFAQSVIDAKKAGKWRKTWVQKFLDQRDAGDRCHASINPLQARTARMSISGIPAQTLPAGDSLIRRCFVADPGHRIVSVDYQAQELRVLAALSGDATMIQAFREDADLHLLTARAAFGDHITKDDPERKYAKVVNFGRVYGGGAKTVAEQTGLDLDKAQQVVAGFDRAYPGVAALSKKLQKEAIRNGYITTPVGRRLPVDQARAYSALNYLIQSSSRDVTCRALIRLHKSGFTPYLRLPIHDEVLASVPEAKAAWGAREIGRVMQEEMGPVHIGTDAEVGGRSWGSLYGADY
jgi:DNA polymerase-1